MNILLLSGVLYLVMLTDEKGTDATPAPSNDCKVKILIQNLSSRCFHNSTGFQKLTSIPFREEMMFTADMFLDIKAAFCSEAETINQCMKDNMPDCEGKEWLETALDEKFNCTPIQWVDNYLEPRGDDVLCTNFCLFQAYEAIIKPCDNEIGMYMEEMRSAMRRDNSTIAEFIWIANTFRDKIVECWQQQPTILSIPASCKFSKTKDVALLHSFFFMHILSPRMALTPAQWAIIEAL